jgi:hypothetical protein
MRETAFIDRALESAKWAREEFLEAAEELHDFYEFPSTGAYEKAIRATARSTVLNEFAANLNEHRAMKVNGERALTDADIVALLTTHYADLIIDRDTPNDGVIGNYIYALESETHRKVYTSLKTLHYYA